MLTTVVRPVVAGLVLVFLSVEPNQARVVDEGKAEGTLTVNGEATELKYAYAKAQPGFFDETKEDVVVILSNIPLNQEAIEDEFERMQMERDGKLKSVEVTLNAEHQPISVRIRHNAFEASPSGSGHETFEPGAIDENQVEGNIETTGLQDFFGTTYEYAVAFKSKIHRKAPPKPPTPEEMKAAKNSPQAKVYLEYTNAVLAGNIDALKKLVIPEMLEELNAPDAKEMLEFLQMVMPKQVEFLRITVDGKTAKLEMRAEQEGEKMTGTTEFMLDGKEWKVGHSKWQG